MYCLVWHSHAGIPVVMYFMSTSKYWFFPEIWHWNCIMFDIPTGDKAYLARMVKSCSSFCLLICHFFSLIFFTPEKNHLGIQYVVSLSKIMPISKLWGAISWIRSDSHISWSTCHECFCNYPCCQKGETKVPLCRFRLSKYYERNLLASSVLLTEKYAIGMTEQ